MSFDSLYHPPKVPVSQPTVPCIVGSMPPPTVDYLNEVDEDIKKLFAGRSYMSFEPLMYQLHKDILKLCEAIESKW